MASASSFQYLEGPVNYANDLLESRSNIKKMGGAALGFIVVPLEAACTPLTILIDAATGIKESALVFRGNDFQEVNKVLFKKVVAFPIQQIAFAAVVGVVPAALFFTAGLVYTIASFVLWPLTHAAAKKVVEKLSILFGTSIYDQGHKGIRNCYIKWDLHEAISININKNFDPKLIVSGVKDVIIAHARKGKIAGLTEEMLDEQMAFEELSSLVVFYLLLCMNNQNQHAIVNILSKFSRKDQNSLYDLSIKSRCAVQAKDFDFFHRMFCKDDSLDETQKNQKFKYINPQKNISSEIKFNDFFKEIGEIASNSISESDFYSLLNY